jgi:uncharacterized protein (DUF1697 family)
MTRYIALLRAVNVGGTGKLAMADLKALCAQLGFAGIETYIASGNVVFDAELAAGKARALLEKGLLALTGKGIDTFVRTAAEMRGVLTSNPFKDKDPRLTYAFFLQDKPRSDALSDARGRVGEEIHLGSREIYVYYPAGMGQSKLRIPAASAGTARNMKTVEKLVEMASGRRVTGPATSSNAPRAG